ncbi:MAG: type II toxin-antitoxin system RelE/ParE family toxin [Gemmatimonadota bacterium]
MPVALSPRAEKDLGRLPPAMQSRIIAALGRYVETAHGDVRRLKGYDPPRARLRVGDYRAIFREEGDTLLVLRVRHRKDAY